MEEILELKKYTMFKSFKETLSHYFIYTKIPLIESDNKGNVFTSHVIFKIDKYKLTLKKNYWNSIYDPSIHNYKFMLQYRNVVTRNNSCKNKKQEIISHLNNYFGYSEKNLEQFL